MRADGTRSPRVVRYCEVSRSEYITRQCPASKFPGPAPVADSIKFAGIMTPESDLNGLGHRTLDIGLGAPVTCYT